MANRRLPKAMDSTTICEDADLNQGELLPADGTRLTEQRAGEMAEQARRRGGRPSLTGDASVSPRVSFRLTPGIRDRAAVLAAREGKTISQLAREALEQRVNISRGSR